MEVVLIGTATAPMRARANQPVVPTACRPVALPDFAGMADPAGIGQAPAFGDSGVDRHRATTGLPFTGFGGCQRGSLHRHACRPGHAKACSGSVAVNDPRRSTFRREAMNLVKPMQLFYICCALWNGGRWVAQGAGARQPADVSAETPKKKATRRWPQGSEIEPTKKSSLIVARLRIVLINIRRFALPSSATAPAGHRRSGRSSGGR